MGTRSILGGRAFRVGVLVGLATVLLTGAAVYVLSLIPLQSFENALGVEWGREDRPTRLRVARSLLSPWLGEVHVHADTISSGRQGLVAAQFFVLCGVLVLAGLVVRRLVPRQRLERTVALVAAALAAAALLFVLALLLPFDEDRPLNPHWDFAEWHYALAGFVIVVVVGAFAFGVVATWPLRVRVPAQAAGLFVGAVLLVATLLFPVLVVAGPASAEPKGRSVYIDMAWTTTYAPGVAAATLPLAVGAPARFEVDTEVTASPFDGFSREAFYTYWPALSKYMDNNETGTIRDYAAVGEGGFQALVGFLAAAIVAVWIVTAILVARLLGSGTWRTGLESGVLLGGFAFGLLAVSGWLASYRAIGSGEGYPKPFNLHWGPSIFGVTQAGVTLIVLASLAAIAYSLVASSVGSRSAR